MGQCIVGLAIYTPAFLSDRIPKRKTPPLKVSARRIYFGTDSPLGGFVLEYFCPEDYILNKASAGENISSSIETISPWETTFRVTITFVLKLTIIFSRWIF